MLVPGYERAYGQAAQLVRDRVPARALVVCSDFSGTIYYYTDLPTLIWDTLVPDEFARYASLARAARRPIYALIFDRHEAEVLRQRCPGTWMRIASTGNIGLWELR
jgi:hypothetical protein